MAGVAVKGTSMNLVNTHERILMRTREAVFNDLVALGTDADRVWPDPTMPFRRTEGPMRVGITQERHGAIRAVLDAYELHTRIVWRAQHSFLQGTHTFEVQDVGNGCTRARHVVRARLAWWFAPLWWLYVGGVHDRIIERLLDRLAEGAAPHQAGVCVR
jgi:hypothetical protein